MDFQYNNNYAWAGITEIMYNIELEQLLKFNEGDTIPQKKINFTDFGFGFKKQSDSKFIYISVLNNDPLWDTSNNKKVKIPFIVENITGALWGTDNVNGYLYPYIIMINNLTPNTSYNICSYYVINGTLTQYNSQTISTLANDSSKKVTWTKGDGWGLNADQENDFIINGIDYCINIVNSFCNINKNITISIAGGNSIGSAGSADLSTNSISFNKYATLSYGGSASREIIMHELGHLLLNQDFPSEDSMRYMEWASHKPKAVWVWANDHCYPVIAQHIGQLCSDWQLHKMAAAYQVSQG